MFRLAVDLGELYNQYHLIFQGYGWSREQVENLRRSERERWSSFIKQWYENIWGGGDS